MVTKKVRTEYMKKFKDPKWDSFSKCYEDCLKYRLTRRVMEGAHRPWFWEGWEGSSESSGWSTPLGRGSRVGPLSVASPDTTEVTQRLMELRTTPGPKHCSGAEESEEETGGGGGAKTDTAVVQNGPNEVNANANDSSAVNGFHDDTPTDNGPIDSASSDGEILQPRARQRPRRRPQKTEPGQNQVQTQGQRGGKTRAKSQPPAISRERESRLDWTQKHMEARRTPIDSHTSDVCVQTGRPRTGLRSHMRRTRSADLDKIRKNQLSVSDSPWVTEYMRCFSARIR
ncbi:centriole, cilia and spindle-associated protein [Periophthalmus magnuspinnatus]|uniref:centriole, cilia and spindle-associated protein n=1 Tax=Periophthalmus magnuspinnatus TaxID=409849 RepID=UPI00145B3349|nr:centriole, cilia and spindle-associated protein [Periophthalmus magnuspinnatus]